MSALAARLKILGWSAFWAILWLIGTIFIMFTIMVITIGAAMLKLEEIARRRRNPVVRL